MYVTYYALYQSLSLSLSVWRVIFNYETRRGKNDGKYRIFFARRVVKKSNIFSFFFFFRKILLARNDDIIESIDRCQLVSPSLFRFCFFPPLRLFLSFYRPVKSAVGRIGTNRRETRTPPFLCSFSASVDPPPRKQYQLGAIFGQGRAAAPTHPPLMNALVRFINL